MQEASAFAPKHPTNLNEFIRGWNDVLCLWRLCRIKDKCFKTRGCHGDDARLCFHSHIVLLPTELQGWMNAIADASDKDLSYDEAIESMTDTEAEGALEEWHQAVSCSEKLRKAAGKVTWEEPGWLGYAREQGALCTEKAAKSHDK